MIRALAQLHRGFDRGLRQAFDAGWTLVFKLAERRFPPDEPQSFDEAAHARAGWLRSHRRQP